MSPRRSMTTALLLTVALLAAPGAVLAQAPKPGGVLTVMQREELPQGLSILETSTIATVWPASPCFNNLVYFDPAKPMETPDTIVGELALDRLRVAEAVGPGPELAVERVLPEAQEHRPRRRLIDHLRVLRRHPGQ